MPSDEARHHGYAAVEVPVEAQGSGWRIFFVVAGTVCGLPVFILSANIFGSLALREGLIAVVIGTSISSVLGATSAYTGSRARSGLALLSDHAFGPWGSQFVKLLIAVSLIGWFGVNIGVLGATAASALGRMTAFDVRPLVIGIPVSIAITLSTARGISSIERIGNLLVPVTLAVLALSVALTWPHMQVALAKQGSGAMSFGGAVSAIVGSYVVGIVIQPDYGRFVRRPAGAAMGAGFALGVAFPLVMLLSAFASLALGAPDLISAMIGLGFGVPALAVLMLGAWIDSSASLYSASLSFANQLPRVKFGHVVTASWFVGLALVLLGADTAFIPFLVSLGLTLPPLATILVLSHFLGVRHAKRIDAIIALSSWAVGTALGVVAATQSVSMTQLPVLDAVLGTAIVFCAIRAAVTAGRPAEQ